MDNQKCPICGEKLIWQHAFMGELDEPPYDWECENCGYECDTKELKEDKNYHQKWYDYRISSKVNSAHCSMIQDLRELVKSFEWYERVCDQKRKWATEDD